MLLVVACDPGTKSCAFAVFKDGELIKTVKVKSTFDKIRAFFDEINDEFKERFLLVIEDQYLSLNVHTLKKLVEIRTTVIVIARLSGAENCIIINPQKWQQAELGLHTRAKRVQRKRLSCFIASSIIGRRVKDNDIADAVCIGDYFNRTQTLHAGG